MVELENKTSVNVHILVQGEKTTEKKFGTFDLSLTWCMEEIDRTQITQISKRMDYIRPPDTQ